MAFSWNGCDWRFLKCAFNVISHSHFYNSFICIAINANCIFHMVQQILLCGKRVHVNETRNLMISPERVGNVMIICLVTCAHCLRPMIQFNDITKSMFELLMVHQLNLSSKFIIFLRNYNDKKDMVNSQANKERTKKWGRKAYCQNCQHSYYVHIFH